MEARPWHTSSPSQFLKSCFYREEANFETNTLEKKAECKQWSQIVDVVSHPSRKRDTNKMQVKGKIILGPSSEQSTTTPPSRQVSDMFMIMCPYWIKPIEMRWGECWGCSGVFSGSSTTCKHNLWKNKSINKKNGSWRLCFLQCLQLLGKMFLTLCRWEMSRCIPPAVTNRSGVNVFFPSQQFIFTVQETHHAGNKKILNYYLKHESSFSLTDDRCNLS